MGWGWSDDADALDGQARSRDRHAGRERIAGHGSRVEAPPARERDPAAGAGHTEAGHRFFRPGGKSMRFALIDRAKKEVRVHLLCRVLGVSQSGYFASKDRPASRCQQGDMVMLALVRSAFALSNGTYGTLHTHSTDAAHRRNLGVFRPRMTRELKDDGFAIGRRRTARLMRENGLRARQKRRFKALLSLSKGDHRQRARLADRAKHHRPGFHGNGPESEVGRRHLLRLDP